MRWQHRTGGATPPPPGPPDRGRPAPELDRATPTDPSASFSPRINGTVEQEPVQLRPPPRTRFMWSSRNLRSRSSRFCAAAAAAVPGLASSSEPEEP